MKLKYLKKRYSPALIYSLMGVAGLLLCILFLFEVNSIQNNILNSQYTEPNTTDTIDKSILSYDDWMIDYPYQGFRLLIPPNWHIENGGNFVYKTPLYGYRKTTSYFSPGFTSGSQDKFALNGGVKKGARIKIISTLYDQNVRKKTNNTDFCLDNEETGVKQELLKFNEINKIDVCKVQVRPGESNEITYNLTFDGFYHSVVLDFNRTNETEEVIQYFQNVTEKLIASFDTYEN